MKHQDMNTNNMTTTEALDILTEFQKWRRAEPPYDGDTPETYRTIPYTGKVIGEAIDVAIAELEKYK